MVKGVNHSKPRTISKYTVLCLNHVENFECQQATAATLMITISVSLDTTNH